MNSSVLANSIPGSEGKDNQPNILLILTDQQHIDTISAAGCPSTHTPAMDRIVRAGTTFMQSHSTNPVCSPARSSILTGRPTTETGIQTNGKRIQGMPNIGQWFSDNSDYFTVYSGKWHLPEGSSHFIPGFKVISTMKGGVGVLCDASISTACTGFIRNYSKKNPFLMVASFLQPHDICEWLRINADNNEKLPYPELKDKLPDLPDNFDYVPDEPEYMKNTRANREPGRGKWSADHWRYYRWSYYRHIEMVDREIGTILDALDETGLAENTLIILTSDHGEGMGHHQMVRKNILYDEMVKVPFVISCPGKISADKIDDTHLVTGLDIMPTLCDYAGIKPPDKQRGLSLRPVLEDPGSTFRDFIVSEAPGNRGRMVRSTRFKLIVYYKDPAGLLFDMIEDPGETRNLYHDPKHTKVVKEHKKMLLEWEASLERRDDLNLMDAWWYTNTYPSG